MRSEEPKKGNLSVHFWESGNARYDKQDNVITLPDPEWAAAHMGPDYEWTGYWQVVAHEVAHRVIYAWFGGVNHGETFYALLIALCAYWDLPPEVMDSEIGYHTRNYKKGKMYLALLAMDRINRIASSADCNDRIIFDLKQCEGTPCTVHSPDMTGNPTLAL